MDRSTVRKRMIAEIDILEKEQEAERLLKELGLDKKYLVFYDRKLNKLQVKLKNEKSS